MCAQMIEIGSVIKLQHVATRRLLRESIYTSENDPDQPLIVTTPQVDEADDWQVERSTFESWPRQHPLTSDQQVCLRNCRTQRRLHAHLPFTMLRGDAAWIRPFFWPRKEVTAFLRSSDGVGDDSDPWSLDLLGEECWKIGRQFRLKHVAPNRQEQQDAPKYLHSNNTNMANHVGLGGANGVACQKVPDSDSLWVAVNVRDPHEYVIEQLDRIRRVGGDSLDFRRLGISELPPAIGHLSHLKSLNLEMNRLSDVPAELARLNNLQTWQLDGNPLNPELAAAYKEGGAAFTAYLRAKAESQVVLNEAKLILIGEGEVGKSCLLGALRGDPWNESRRTTHGIEIKSLKLINPDSGAEITLNGWDFGGQRVYRPTHQLFFSAPAVYLVVWKPREGPKQGFVKEWIKLVKHREPDAKILVVATHGGPGERQPDIDRQEIWDLFGRETLGLVGGNRCVNHVNPFRLDDAGTSVLSAGTGVG